MHRILKKIKGMGELENLILEKYSAVCGTTEGKLSRKESFLSHIKYMKNLLN